MFNNLLVVCTGNICRSPMGEYLVREKTGQLGKMLKVSSAGIGALVGQPAAQYAVEVMAERGIDIKNHRAQQLQFRHISENDLILVMETWQQKEIEAMYPIARGRVHLVGKWGVGEIPDPYQKPKDAFVEVFEKIQQSCEAWYGKLW